MLVLLQPRAPNMLPLQCRPLPNPCQEALPFQFVFDCGALPSMCKSDVSFLGV